MTKYIFYFLVVFVTNVSAQESYIDWVEKKEIINNNQYDLVLNFNSLKKIIKKNDFFELEIQPINDCLSGIDGQIMFDVVRIDLKKTKINEFTINKSLVKRKCFKYRIKSIKDNKITYSQWNFHALVR